MAYRLFFALCVGLLCGGCTVERTISVQTDPPGALVWLNDQEVGRTPFTRNFTWYGTYDVEVRKEGYQTLKTRNYVKAPWWQWVPFDFFAEMTPGHHIDAHTMQFSLQPESNEPANAQELIRRGQQLASRLESGERTKSPDTQPTTKPSKTGHHHATTGPATAPAGVVAPTDVSTAPTTTEIVPTPAAPPTTTASPAPAPAPEVPTSEPTTKPTGKPTGAATTTP